MNELQNEIIKTLNVKSIINVEKETRVRIDFLKNMLVSSDLKGFVLGISGGVDSTTAGKLAQLAVDELNEEQYGKYKFIAVRLPYGKQADESDAQEALSFIQPTKSITHDIRHQVDAAIFHHASEGRIISDFVKGNHKARARMLVQYDIAAEEKLLVIGTDHAAEAVTGFFTKYGDGACDVTPLAGLTKRQVREIAKHLGAPESLYLKTPTADLLDAKPGQTDEDELGLTYDEINDYLEGKVISKESAEKIEKRYLLTMHKRSLPYAPQDQDLI